jgi:hypothetical protein
MPLKTPKVDKFMNRRPNALRDELEEMLSDVLQEEFELKENLRSVQERLKDLREILNPQNFTR